MSIAHVFVFIITAAISMYGVVVFDYFARVNFHEFCHYMGIRKQSGEEVIILGRSLVPHKCYFPNERLYFISGPKFQGRTYCESNYAFAKDNAQNLSKIACSGPLGDTFFIRIEGLAILLLNTLYMLIAYLRLANISAFTTSGLMQCIILGFLCGLVLGYAVILVVVFKSHRKSKKEETGWNDYMICRNPNGFVEYQQSEENEEPYGQMKEKYVYGNSKIITYDKNKKVLVLCNKIYKLWSTHYSYPYRK